ncbi:type VI secretion system membrane subunit TssM [Alkalimarinus coralli]|uniref:type VI secretion system membrane subunit TssM n=1 Tax=Alkalimarinus coralli TaxID=2935863 RepID=UPI00202AE261|nr:type VI secretion system membrane subunit TssM [Alkalimarinus coralli]
MNWKNNRFFTRKRADKLAKNDNSRETSSKVYQSLFRQQLIDVSNALGERKVERLARKLFYKKTVYLVLESPHASLTELSGNSLANISYRGKGSVTPSSGSLKTAYDQENGYILPSWHVDASSLLMKIHFEDEVFSSGHSFEDLIPPLVAKLKPGNAGRYLGGLLIYVHRHDLLSESTPAWLNKMASFVAQVASKTHENIPVYLVLEGMGVSDQVASSNDHASLLATPVGMFRDHKTVLSDNFSQWYSQAKVELTKRLLRKTLKDVQYVHNVEARKRAFSELKAIEQSLNQLKRVSEHLNHQWNFSEQHTVPWIRAAFVAPQGAGAMSRLAMDSNSGKGFGSHHWWQRFSHILIKDRGCGSSESNTQVARKTALACSAAVMLFGALWGGLMWRDYAKAEQAVSQFSEQRLRVTPDGNTLLEGHSQGLSSTVDGRSGFEQVLAELTGVELHHNQLNEASENVHWPSLFTFDALHRQQDILVDISENIVNQQFGQMLNTELLTVLKSSNDFETLYPALKSYLLFHQDREKRAEYLMWWFGRRWHEVYQYSPDRRQKLARHLSAFLNGQEIDAQIDHEAVSVARAKMLATPLAKRMYFEIKQLANSQQPSASGLKEIIGYRQAGVFNNASEAVPTFYTLLGYQTLFLPKVSQVVEKANADEWVLAEPSGESVENTKSDIDLLESAIYDLYIADYMAEWEQFLSQLAISKTNSFGQLSTLIKNASGNEGAIRRVLNYVYDNTGSYQALAAVDVKGVVERVESAAPASTLAPTHRVRNGLKGAAGYLSSKNSLPVHPMSRVSRHFERLNSVINNSENKSSAIDEVDKQMLQLEEYLADFDSSTNQMSNLSSVFDATVKRAKGSRKDAISQLKRTSKLLPEPLNKWVGSVSTQAWGQMVAHTKRYIQDAYQNEVYVFYRDNLNQKYPFHTLSKNDTDVDQFSEFFKPEGYEQSFLNHYIKPFIRTGKKRWSERTVDGLSIGLKRGYLSQLQRADKIRNALFNKRHELHAELQLQPIYLDANISRFELNLMGERLSYRHGPQKTSKISWPASLNEDDISMRFEDYNGNLVTDDISGEWSLFRMIEQYGKEAEPNQHRFRMSFEVNGQRAVYKISGRTLTPDLLGELSKYRIPSTPLS